MKSEPVHTGYPGFSEPNLFAVPSFDPSISDAESKPEWVGKRRKATSAVAAIPWQWPDENATAKQRYDSFDDWHDIAMQILDKDGGSFRLMAVYKKVMQWKPGAIWASDEELAAKAGRCSLRTVSRDITAHKRAGIILLENGWRKNDRKFVRSRTIRLAVPEAFPSFVILADDQNYIATRGLSGEGNHIATRGPNHIATRGLITIDTTEEGASSNVSA